MTDSLNPTELIQRGQAAARTGRREEARQYLRQAIQQAPDSVDAWLDLAGVVDAPLEKVACFEAVLELDPDNVQAQLGLDLLRRDAERKPGAEPEPSDELEAAIAEASRKLENAVGPPPAGETPADDGVMYCANHPNVETVLRCNRCGKPICTRCAVQTPVGYRCKECVGQQQAIFFTGGAIDYVIGGLIALILGGIAGYIITLLGAWFFALILGPTLGIGIAEAVRLAVRRRRSRYLWAVVGAGIVVGTAPSWLLALSSVWTLLSLGLFLVLAVGTATARLR